jgi:hypothetical protein
VCKDFSFYIFGRTFKVNVNNNNKHFNYSDVFKVASSFRLSLSKYAARVNNLRKYIVKKYIYTINHKRIALNYLYFSMWTGLSGAALATMVRLELAYPGSPFFKGDSLRYLQVITAHGLIMVFFVVVPILFGCFANFVIPYHVGSKDVAFPRLNSIAFWLLPCGYLLVAKTAFLRPTFWRYYDKPHYRKSALMQKKTGRFGSFDENGVYSNEILTRFLLNEKRVLFQKREEKNGEVLTSFISPVPKALFFWHNLVSYPESFWRACSRSFTKRRRKIYFTKCSERTNVTAGWTFITPFSSNTKYTGFGSQDILIVSVIFAGISSTVGFTNLLITRRTLAMPGLRNRRVLLPFISIALFLTMRMLAIVTPILGASMFMLMMDRHWQTTFFEFAYGGDTVLFQHLFWFLIWQYRL